MKMFYPFSGSLRRPLLLHLLTLVGCFLLAVVNPTIGQAPVSCGVVNCTSNDVRVISSYLSGPNGAPINCLDEHPFANAELHLVVFSNTQRVGVSISGSFNQEAGGAESAILFANCFKEITLNNSGNNDLVFPFPLPNAVCGDDFSLSNLFVSWGTGKTDFCDGSTAAHCPETKAKCRFVPDETIPVTVKLEVDFSSMAGVCATNGDSKTFNFTPSIVTEKNIVYPVTFTWNFGDGSAPSTTTAANLADVANANIAHTYANEGLYTVTLVGSDASPFFSVTSTHTVFAVSCCNLQAPQSAGDQSECAALPIQKLTALAFGAAGETITWFNAAKDGEEVSDPSLSAVGSITYYAESSTSNCVSPTRTAVTLTLTAQTITTFDPIDAICSGGNFQLPTKSKEDISGTWSPAVDNTKTTLYTFTPADGQCATTSELTVVINEKTVTSFAPIDAICSGSSITLPQTSLEGISGSWSPAVNNTETTKYTFTPADGQCATTAELTVVVNPLTTDGSITTSICAGQSYKWPANGQTYNTTQTGLTLTEGCNTATLNLTVTPLTTTGSVTTSICAGESYLWPANGVSYTTAQTGLTYTVECNTATLNLTINPLPPVSGIGGAFNKSCVVNVSGKTIGETPVAGFTYSWLPTTGLSNASIGNPVANPSVTTTYTVTKTNKVTKCSNTATVTVTVLTFPCDVFYTYTQGYYSSTGTSCTPLGGLKGALALVQYSLDNTDLAPKSGKLELGKPGASFTVNYAEAAALVAAMPGGGTAGKLLGNYDFVPSNAYPTPPLKKGKIDNVLLSQTITLGLNINIQGDNLAKFLLHSGYLTTISAAGTGCPRVIASCPNGTISSMKLSANAKFMAFLEGKTVNELYAIASAALGGSLPVIAGGTVTYSDINAVVDVINRSFDGGRFFIGYYGGISPQTCATLQTSKPLEFSSNLAVRAAFVSLSDQITEVSELTVTTSPNPFTDRVRFRIVSPVSGNASLDIYNVMGQKIGNVFTGHLQAGRSQSIDYRVPTQSAGTLIYTLRVGDHQANGKIVKAQ